MTDPATSTIPAMPTGAELLREADAAADRALERCRSPLGLQAASDLYPEVWARDLAITFLGAGLDRHPDGMTCLRTSLATLAGHQDEFGQIPVWVSVRTAKPWFTGAQDASPWFVVACCRYAQLSGDRDWLLAHRDALANALRWCESRDVRHLGLMEGDDGTDWADIMPHHGRMLFPNVVRVVALDLALQVLPDDRDAPVWRRQREGVRSAIQDRFWVRIGNLASDQDHTRNRAAAALALREMPHFLAWESMFEIGDRFDVPGNLLAILTGIATTDQGHAILDAIEKYGINRPYPVQVIYPVIQPGDKDWHEYFKVWNLNLPHQYCNGGIWPWVGGLYVAALAKLDRHDEALRQLESLARANQAGDRTVPAWRFSEWLHGVHGTACGGIHQAWSAGMWLFARSAVKTGRTPGFGGDL
jgi:glycogen debranching enzyme